MSLSLILCSNLADADSAYTALQAGTNFETVVKKYSISPSAEKGGNLGAIDVHMYGDEIQDALKSLKPGEYTHPISFGQNYVIYKRMAAENM